MLLDKLGRNRISLTQHDNTGGREVPQGTLSLWFRGSQQAQRQGGHGRTKASSPWVKAGEYDGKGGRADAGCKLRVQRLGWAWGCHGWAVAETWRKTLFFENFKLCYTHTHTHTQTYHQTTFRYVVQ
jgi:hypothetical protein